MRNGASVEMKNHDFQLRPSLSKPTRFISMRKLTATLCLTIAVLLGVTGCKTANTLGESLGYAENNEWDKQKWMRLAEEGYAYAQYNLGFRYEIGFGVPKDYKTAVTAASG